MRSRAAIPSLLLAGAAIRFLICLRWLNYPNAEAGNVARAIGDGRGFADAFFSGQGPTAHLMPIAPLLGGAVYALLGTGIAGGVTLALLSLAVSLGCYLLAARVVRLLGASREAMLLGLAFMMLIPIHYFTETVRWQVWDGGLATLLLLATLAIILAAERGCRVVGFEIARAAFPALALLVNPIAGIAAAACALVFLWRDRARTRPIRPLLALTLAVAILFAPWVARNALTFGRPILTRDNLGLELAIANEPGAIAPADPEAAFNATLAAVHPNSSADARRRLRAMGGEAAYSDWLGAATLRWMKANPVAVVRIWLRHLTQLILPRPWMFALEHERFLACLRAAIVALVNIAGLIEIAIMLRAGERGAIYPPIIVATVLALTAPFQPVMRYCWILYPLLGMLAARAVSRLPPGNRLSRRIAKTISLRQAVS